MMTWKRFAIPQFDHRALRGMDHAPPQPVSSDEAGEIVRRAAAGDAGVGGGHAVEPDPALLERLNFTGEFRQMVLCALPGEQAHLLARSMAWFNQRAFLLDANSADAAVVVNWRTPRTHNTRLGPENGVPVAQRVLYLLSGRIVEEETRGNRLILDNAWAPGAGRSGFRVLAGCDKGGDRFHDSYFEFTWAA